MMFKIIRDSAPVSFNYHCDKVPIGTVILTSATQLLISVDVKDWVQDSSKRPGSLHRGWINLNTNRLLTVSTVKGLVVDIDSIRIKEWLRNDV